MNHTLTEEDTIQRKLNESGYTLQPVNLTTWKAIDIRTRASYALTVRNGQYYCIALHGTEPQARAIEQWVRQAVQG